MGLSNLGIFHTVIGIVAIGAAVLSCVKYGKIQLAQRSGKVYLITTIIASVTALGISKQGGFNPGHVLALLILVLVVGAWMLYKRKAGNNSARYFENFFLSFSFFLSMLPTINETLTRVPLGAPLAKDINDPLVTRTLLVVLILFITGTVYQIVRQRKINKG